MALWNPYYTRGDYHYHAHPMSYRNPFSVVDHMLDFMYEIPSQWLTEMSRSPPLNAGRTMEIVNGDDQLKINLQVEDYKPDELNVKVIRDRYLVVEGKKKEQREGDGAEGVVIQKFKRSFVIPQDVDVSKIKSNITNDGMLTIQAPKIVQPAITQERQISIERDPNMKPLEGEASKK